jgi:hypothetical protein
MSKDREAESENREAGMELVRKAAAKGDPTSLRLLRLIRFAETSLPDDAGSFVAGTMIDASEEEWDDIMPY